MAHFNARTARWLSRAAVALLVLLPIGGPLLAQEHKPVTMATLLDRIQIEDFLTRYYYDLSVGKAHELAEYFTEDAVLDVDGGGQAKSRGVIVAHSATKRARCETVEPARLGTERN